MKATDNEYYGFEQEWHCLQTGCEFEGSQSGGIPHARRHFEKTGHMTEAIQIHRYSYHTQASMDNIHSMKDWEGKE